MRARTTVAIAAVSTAAVLSAVMAGSAPAGAEGGGTTSPAVTEYVVGFAPADRAGALDAIEAAGGTVVDVTEGVGLALVTSDDDAFLDTVRSDDVVTGAALNHSVGTSEPGMPHRFAEERPESASASRRASSSAAASGSKPRGNRAVEPLANLQWDMEMIGATASGAWQHATGAGVTVGIIDTGVDASHPDIAPNFSRRLSRNFTTDIPELDGACEVATCVDPADVDDGGHGTHVAGTVAGARNGIGIAGVAPDATIVNVRAGQDSGWFFIYETVAALTYAAEAGLDVVNMSFFVDPYLYNCASAEDLTVPVDPAVVEEMAFIRSSMIAALEYAHDHGVTLVASAGNEHTDLAEAYRWDGLVTSNCLDLPAEGPHVLTVSSIGPSTTKADYSNWGLGTVDIAAPGGWFRDGIGTPAFQTPQNMILSSYPLHVAVEEGLADPDGTPTDAFGVRSCTADGECAYYTYLQGTSMASPHVAGAAALVIQAHGTGHRRDRSLDPGTVTSILLATAADHTCPAGGIEDYTDEGRPASWNADCHGDAAYNGIYGEGIVDATAAVAPN